MIKTSLSLATAALLLVAGVAEAQNRDRDRDRGNRARDANVSFAYADVLRADPVYDFIRVDRPREVCQETEVVHRERGGNATGTIIGAIIGGAVGNQVGRGSGRRAATVAGVIAGGAVGNQATRDGGREYRSVETRCRVIDGYVEEERLLGFDVEYRFRGDVYFSRLDYDPGERLRVRIAVTPAE